MLLAQPAAQVAGCSALFQHVRSTYTLAVTTSWLQTSSCQAFMCAKCGSQNTAAIIRAVMICYNMQWLPDVAWAMRLL
jgi:hypothetical protein